MKSLSYFLIVPLSLLIIACSAEDSNKEKQSNEQQTHQQQTANEPQSKEKTDLVKTPDKVTPKISKKLSEIEPIKPDPEQQIKIVPNQDPLPILQNKKDDKETDKNDD